MPRHLQVVAGSALVLLAAACGEVPTAVPGGDLQRFENAASIVPGTCTNLAQLNALAATIFTPGSSPNINSVKGKLKNLDKTVRQGRIADAKAHATEIVAFTLKKYNQGGLSGSSVQVEVFTNAILCFAGFDLEVEQPENTFLILPSDLPQIVTNTEGNAGVSFPANPVTEPTLVEIAQIPNTYPLGAGPLDTKLDQYPGFIQITKTSETNAPLAKPVVVGVCAAGVIPTEVLDRLRLGHGASAGFEVTPAATADFISCPEQIADAGADPLWKRLASAMLPRQLHAFQRTARGGVGGTVTEFSPFAPVDPELSFGGGVGGTVTEFIRVPAPGALLKGVPSNTPSIVVDPCLSGTAGEPVDADCAPSVLIKTRLGTVLVGVPVDWEVLEGGGLIAPRAPECGLFDESASMLTDGSGRATVCWTLGAPGSNRIRATPSVGGDAPSGVTFVPGYTEFETTAIAGAPTAISVLEGNNQVTIAGTQTPIQPRVRVTDAHGYPVSGARIDWQTSPTSGGGTSTVSPLFSITGFDGTAAVTWTTGLGLNLLYAGALEGGVPLIVTFQSLGTAP